MSPPGRSQRDYTPNTTASDPSCVGWRCVSSVKGGMLSTAKVGRPPFSETERTYSPTPFSFEACGPEGGREGGGRFIGGSSSALWPQKNRVVANLLRSRVEPRSKPGAALSEASARTEWRTVKAVSDERPAAAFIEALGARAHPSPL